METWSLNALSITTSYIGKPIWLDDATSARRMTKFAKVSIEITAQSTLVIKFQLNYNLSTKEISVPYDYIPPKWCTCNVFGREEPIHAEQTKPQWIPKTTPSTEAPPAKQHEFQAESSGPVEERTECRIFRWLRFPKSTIAAQWK